MKSEITLRNEAMKILTEKLGKIDTERFISSIKKDSFDYTEWRKDLWKDKTIEEIHELAGQYEKNHTPK